MTKIITN